MSSVLKLALILLAAAVLALGARSLYVSSRAAPAAVAPDPRVLTVAADVPAGLLLREGDLNWLTVASGRVPEGALREGTPQAVVSGSLLRHSLTSGTVLKSGDLIRPDAPGFLAAALSPGMRAVSVPINDVSGNAGLIQPGDYVDMILTQHLGGGRGDLASPQMRRVVSETVVRHARIIAVGSSFQRDSDSAKSSRARTVTIEVDPRTAEAVTVAAEIGTLSLALRSFAVADAAAAEAQPEGASVVAWSKNQRGKQDGPVWGSDVSRVLAPPEPADAADSKPGVPRRILILRGDQKQEQELSIHE